MIVNSAFKTWKIETKGCGQTDTPFTQGYPKSGATFKWKSYRLKNIVKSDYCRNWNSNWNDLFRFFKVFHRKKTDFFGFIKKGVVSNAPLISLYLNLRKSNLINCAQNGNRCHQNDDTPNATLNELRIVKVLSQSHDKICRVIRWSVLCGVGVLGYIKCTTKLLAVKPSRHPLAIFVPKICMGYYLMQKTTGTKNHHTFYDGLRKPNTIPFLGNKLRRLVTVVETRRPKPCAFVDEILTKLLGGLSHA